MSTQTVNDKVEISWSAPFNNYESIDKYLVKVKTADASPTYIQELVNCDASTIEVIAFLKCRIPVSVLRASPYSLPAGTLVVALV